MSGDRAMLFQWIHGRVADIARRAGHDVPPPASEQALERLAATWPDGLPPSYRRFLRLQDGWPLAWRGLSLLGTDGLLTEGEFAATLQRFRDLGLLIIGVGDDRNGDVLAFDTRDAAPDGEWPLNLCTAEGAIRETYSTFEDWLERATFGGVARQHTETDPS